MDFPPQELTDCLGDAKADLALRDGEIAGIVLTLEGADDDREVIWPKIDLLAEVDDVIGRVSAFEPADNDEAYLQAWQLDYATASRAEHPPAGGRLIHVDGQPLDRHHVSRIVRRVAHHAGCRRRSVLPGRLSATSRQRLVNGNTSSIRLTDQVSGERSSEGVEAFWNGSVPDPQSALLTGHQAGFEQQLHVMADSGLRPSGDRDEIAGAHLVTGRCDVRQQSQPDRIRQCRE